MPRITLGNRLYLYQLFSRELGVGKQTMLTSVEDVLAADDILPCDLGCSDVRELLEALDDFVRLTVFKKGRVYATVRSVPEWDELLAKSQSPATNKKPADTKGGHKAWKHKKAGKDPRPAKPRPHGRETIAATTDEAPQDSNVDEEPKAEATHPLESGAALEPAPMAETAATTEIEVETVPEPTPVADPTPATEPAPEVEPTPSAPAPAQKPSISFTVTYDPYAQDESEPEPMGAKPSEKTPVQSDEPPTRDNTAKKLNPPSAQRLFPQHFAEEVKCGDNQLALLYRILPFDVDPLALLDEDWRVARSTETFASHNGLVTFPLRYLTAQEGEPVRVSIRRTGKTTSGKHWSLVAVGDEDLDLNNVSWDGLPARDEGAWSHLSANVPRTTQSVSPLRELSQTIALGPWDELLLSLASIAEPEDWGPRKELLKEYLAVTFYRIRQENKLAVSSDQLHAAFDTGLLNSQSQRIFAFLRARTGDIAWQLQSFETESSSLFMEQFEELPDPTAYITSLADIVLAPPYAAQPATSLAATYGAELQPAMQAALARARRSYRLATPAYDPQQNELRLLLPITLAQNAPTQALVLAPQQEGGYLATALLSLEHARICARVISADLPAWLAS